MANVAVFEDLPRLRQKFSGIEHGRAVVGEPKLAHVRFAGEGGCFCVDHVALGGSVGLFGGIAVEPFGDEKIALAYKLSERRRWATVGGVAQTQTATRRTEHVLWLEDPAVVLNALALLQNAPKLHRNAAGFRPLHIETTGARQMAAVGEAGHAVLHWLGGPLQRTGGESGWFLERQLMQHELERKRSADHGEPAHDALEPLAAPEMQRFGAVVVGDGHEQPRQPANVVAVVVGEKNVVDVFRAEAAHVQRHLCGFATVDEHVRAFVAHEQRGEKALGQRHHAAAAEQTDVKHDGGLLCFAARSGAGLRG